MKLVTSNPHQNAQRLYDYLQSIYGKSILSGHQADHFAQDEWHFINNYLGDYPAIKGLDFMGSSSASIKNGENPNLDTDLALDWWHEGGLVTFCWHWRSPCFINDDYHGSFYTKSANLNLADILSNTTSNEYKLLLTDIDLIATQLKRLHNAGVPILWRPLHEAAGAWFWWGASGSKPYIELWQLIFNRLTNIHKLNNLIWVCNCADKAWYPGDEYVDLLGDDIYAQKGDYSSQKTRFDVVAEFSPQKKPVALSENGMLTDPDSLIADEANWLWFMTWRSFCQDAISEGGASEAMLKKIYSHPYVITKGQLPNFTK